MKKIFTKTDLKNIIRMERKHHKEYVKDPCSKIQEAKHIILQLAFRVINYDDTFLDCKSNSGRDLTIDFSIRDVEKLSKILGELNE